jgi:SNF2 family DNA or RNA helicase
MGGYENKQIVSYKNIDELKQKIDKYSMRILKKECLDLPDKLYQNEYFDLTKKQMEYYNSIKRDGLLLLNKINAKHDESQQHLIFKEIITRLTKMQQVISGYIYTDKHEVIFLVEKDKNPKLNKLKELIKQIEGKVIIWSRFTTDIDLIMNEFKDISVRYDGSINTEKRKNNIQDFKHNHDIKCFIANLQTGSTGLNLTEAETVIYFSNGYNLELRLQSEDRCHRIGTKNNVNYIDLQANKTIDKKIINNLKMKKQISDLIFHGNIFLENE